jgi:plastocyanin
MNYPRLFKCLLALAFPAAAGDLTGHALITKKLTKKALTAAVYNLRGTAPPPAAVDSEPVNEFDQMVVLVEGDSIAQKSPVNVTIDQRNLRFDPDLVVVPVGSTVQFPNWDPIFHSVFSLSKAQPFDLGFYPRGQSRTVKFNRSGIVQVYCHIHANMYAAIVVTSSPWYGKPSEDGSFAFANIPAGRYHVVVWHKVAGVHQVAIDVPETGKAEVTVRVPIDVEPRR